MTHEHVPGLLNAELLARVEQARDPYDKAVWQLLLGEPEAGLAEIQRGLPDLIAGHTANLRLAQVALLADDARAPALAAAASHTALDRFVPGNREYHATMLALMSDDEDRARDLQFKLDAFVSTHDKLRAGQPARVAEVARGLLDRDTSLLTAGVEAFLGWHLRRARTRSDDFNSSRGVISLEAICALILGHRRGLVVPIHPRYRAAQVPLLATHLTEWEGRPLPRALPMTVVTDLVAAAWLRTHGIEIDAAPAPTLKRAPAKRTRSALAASPLADQTMALQALRARIRPGGHPWQQASWTLMLGDAAGARAQLQAAATDANRRWHDQAMANPNIVREHFGLSLVLGDEAGLRQAIPALQAWLRTQEGKPWGVYAHAAGYLDLICDLVGGGDRARPMRAAVDQVSGTLPSTRVAAIALADGDPAGFREGIEGMLTEHAKTLERKTSPPPPICESAVHLVAAARRLAIQVAAHERFATWPVPIEGARVPCDLLGRAAWSGAG